MEHAASDNQFNSTLLRTTPPTSTTPKSLKPTCSRIIVIIMAAYRSIRGTQEAEGDDIGGNAGLAKIFQNIRYHSGKGRYTKQKGTQENGGEVVARNVAPLIEPGHISVRAHQNGGEAPDHWLPCHSHISVRAQQK